MTTQLTTQLTEAEFLKFSQLIEQEVGIHLSDAKMPLLIARLGKRVRRLELATFSDYYDHVVHDHDERVAMFDAISTNETRFFREPKHFELLNARILPEIRAAGRERRAFALNPHLERGLLDGEEPYSLAMTLLDHFDPSEWDLRIDATDLSTRVLDTARDGVWPMRKAAEVPKPFLRRFMLRGTGSQHGTFKAGQELRSVVRFGRLNLTDARYAMPSGYDLILCRNVLIYFTNATRRHVVTNLLHHLAPGGHFFLGHAETLAGIVEGPRTVIPTVYAR